MSTYEGHIGWWQGVLLVSAILSAMLSLQYPEFLIALGGSAGWQVAVVMTLAAMLFFLPTAALASRFPGRGLAEISREVAGPFLGPVLTVAVAAWLTAGVALTVRNFTETFIIAILPQTPPSVLILVVMACVAYASHRGLEAISRATQILFPLIVGLGFLVFAFTLPRTQVTLLYPFWGNGWGETVRGGLTAAGMAAEAVVTLVLGYGFRSGRDLGRSGLLGILIFGLMAASMVTILVTTFGAGVASQMPFAVFDLARLVYLGRFFQRTESLVVLFWFFAAAVRLSTLFHAAVVSLSGALRLPFYRPVIFPLMVLVVSLSLLPKDYVSVLLLERDRMRPAGLFMMGIPLLLLLMALIRRKGGRVHVA